MQEIISVKPSLFHDKTVRESVPLVTEKSNLHNIKSEPVFQLGRNDRHKEDLIDLVLMQRVHKSCRSATSRIYV